MKDLQVNTEIVEITKLTPNPRNPRIASSEALDRLKTQIQELGQYKPVIVDTRTGMIIGGHMRYRALQELGIQNVLVSYITSENDEEALKYMLSDNDNIGVTDKERLLEFIEEFPSLDLKGFATHFEEPQLLKEFMGQFDTDDTVTKSETSDSNEENFCVCSVCGNKHKKNE